MFKYSSKVKAVKNILNMFTIEVYLMKSMGWGKCVGPGRPCSVASFANPPLRQIFLFPAQTQANLSRRSSLPLRRMAQTPDVGGQRFYLVIGKLRPAQRRHRAAILLWLRDAFFYCLRDPRVTAVAPQPLVRG
jgi:hypothetical protein